MKLHSIGFRVRKTSENAPQIRTWKRELSIKKNTIKGYGPPAKPFGVYRETEKYLFMPRFFNHGQEYEDIRKDGKHITANFNGQLRSNQLNVEKLIMDELTDVQRTILCLKTGQGKTICGLKILANLGRKTMIVVHTHFLMKQWEDRIKQFLPEMKIGYFYGPKCDIQGKDIIIGMLQSLSLKDYNSKMFSDVGFTIFDEVHKVGAEQFSKALLRVSSKYVLGLSATPKRGDGLTRILYLHFGKILNPFKNQKLDQAVHVNIVEYTPKDFKETRIKFGGYNFANMTNQLVKNKERNELILRLAMEYAEEGRSILILSARIEHVKTLAAQLDFFGIPAGIFIGGMKMADLESATEKQIIVATYNMFKEGVDVQKLNTLIFATPISKITQAVGRILRKKHEDHTPLIVDVWDMVSQFEKWGVTRQKYYKSKKFITNLGDYEHQTRAQQENAVAAIDIGALIDSEDEENNVNIL